MARILIVEDDPLISRMYQSVFKFDDYDVEIARDGVEGLAAIKKQTPTIVLLDVMMPRMSGIELLEKIKTDPATKGIPVIVLTNLSDVADAEKALELGAVKFIVKSENKPRQVLSQVKEILSGYTRGEVPKTAASTKS